MNHTTELPSTLRTWPSGYHEHLNKAQKGDNVEDVINVWVSMTWITVNKRSTSDSDQTCAETIVDVSSDVFHSLRNSFSCMWPHANSQGLGCRRLIVSLTYSFLQSMTVCENLHRDLWDLELQAHEHKESLGQRRELLVFTGGWCGGLKANKTNTEASQY